MKRGSIPTQFYREKLIQPALIVHVWRRRHNASLWASFLVALKNCPVEFLKSDYCDNDESSDDETEEEQGNPLEAIVLSEEQQKCHDDRLMRSYTQRLTIINNRIKSGIFSIKSSTTQGRYIVRIKTIPTCTCKDYSNGFYCKHLKAVLIGSYKLPHNHSLLTKRLFTKEDLKLLNINLTWCEKTLTEHA